MKAALTVLGGLAMFIYGINIMSDGLKNAAGDKLKKLIELLTRNRFLGVIVGALVTIVTQSSTATTIIVIGFVNAGVMDLMQAVGVIMGSNIGTTFTAQLISFDLLNIALVLLFIGTVIFLFSKNRKIKSGSEILIGFGLLFIGMNIMTTGIAPLANSIFFSTIVTKLNNPFLGFLVGILMTILLQSSTASISLLQAFTKQSLINLNMAFPILFGNNVGSSVTTMLASINTNKGAKKAALVHFFINFIGAVLFMLILRLPAQELVLRITSDNVQRQIANGHTLFNVISVIILFPFAGLLVKLTEKIIKPDKSDEITLFKYIDLTKEIKIPEAFDDVLLEIENMSNMAEKSLKDSALVFKQEDVTLTKELETREHQIDMLEAEIGSYLVKVSNESKEETENNKVNTLLKVLSDLERVGDAAERISKLSEKAIYNNLEFIPEEINEFDLMHQKTIEAVNLATKSLITSNVKLAKKVIKLDKEISSMYHEYKNNHIHRLNVLATDAAAGAIFSDILNNLERASDHSMSIATYVIENNKK